MIVISDTTTKSGGSGRKKPIDLLANMTNFSHIRTRKLGGTVEAITYDRDGKVTSTGNHELGYMTTAVPNIQSVKSRLQQATYNRMVSKLQGQNFNAGVFLGELPETLAFLLHSSSELYKFYRYLKRPRFWRRLYQTAKRNGFKGTFKKGTSSAASLWLMYRYAIMPIVYETQSILEELSVGNTARLRARSTLKESINEVVMNGPVKMTYTGKVIVTSCAYVEPTIGDDVKRELARLGLLNLPALLWELTPFSFVVDWFIPIGDRLIALDAEVGKQVIGHYRSTRVSLHQHVPLTKVVTHYQSGNRRETFFGPSDGMIEESYVRQVYKGLEPPRLVGDTRLNLARYTDAFALVRSLFFKR